MIATPEVMLQPSADDNPALRLRLRLIGAMEARAADGANVLPIGRKSRALLAILGVASPHPVSRGRLASLLWSRRPPEYARASLRQELHRLLAALQPAGPGVLSIARDNLSLQQGLVWIDVEQLTGTNTAKVETLELLGGELLGELDSLDRALDQWLATERRRLRDRARMLAEAVLQEQAEPDHVMLAAQRLLGIDRSHEGAWRALMHGYAVRGDRGRAMQTYEQCREVLIKQQHGSPSSDTERLAAEIRAGTPTSPERNKPLERRLGARWGVRIGVMPLKRLSEGDEEAQVAAGLMDGVITALMKFRGVVLRPLPATPQTDAARSGSICPEFLLEGTIQRVSDRLRLSLRLVDVVDDGCVAWINQWERDFGEMLRQDGLVGPAAAEIEIEVRQARVRRLKRDMPDEICGHDAVLKALSLMTRLRREDAREAGNLLARVREEHPDNASGYFWSAYLILLCTAQGWSDRSAALSAVAGGYAERAVSLDPQDARALAIAGHVRAFLHRRPREALALHDRAVSLNPNLALAWELSATARVYLGEFGMAAQHFDRCRQLLPIGVDGLFCDAGMITAAMLQGDYDAAVSIGRRATELQPSFAESFKPYLAALGHSRRDAQSAAALRRLLAIEPSFCLDGFFSSHAFERNNDRDRYASGLRLAGVPDTASGRELEKIRVLPLPSEVV